MIIRRSILVIGLIYHKKLVNIISTALSLYKQSS